MSIFIYNDSDILFVLHQQQKIKFVQHVLTDQMSEQKQKVKKHNHQYFEQSLQQQSESHTEGKRKIIKKTDCKNATYYQMINQSLLKRKQAAKEVKRIRQQNRRANHKEYVNSLQLKIQEKQMEIQKLNQKIKQLQKKIAERPICKCETELTQTEKLSPLSIPNQLPNEICQQINDDGYEQFRRIKDDSGLRICFGNKNLLFFLVTMCCLTIGSIADNPQIFLQPIFPYKTQSQMFFLQNSQKVLDFTKYNIFQRQKQNEIQTKYDKGLSYEPELYNTNQSVSQRFDIEFSYDLEFTDFSLLSSFKYSQQNFLSLNFNRIVQWALHGRYQYH